MLSGKKHSTTTVAQSVFILSFHTKNWTSTAFLHEFNSQYYTHKYSTKHAALLYLHKYFGLTQHYFTQPSDDMLHVWNHVDTKYNAGPVVCKIFSHSLLRFYLHFSDSSLSTYSRRTHPTIIMHAVGSRKFAWSPSALIWRGKFSRGKEKCRHY